MGPRELRVRLIRQDHSTETAVLKIASDVFDSADTGHVTLLALLDLSAAFDTVDHEILLQRLEHSYCVDGTALQWVRSFHFGRIQVVHFNGHLSTESLLTCGVPQGSVSGPKFFTLYTADVVRIAQSFGVCIHCYADDLQLYVHCCAADVAAAVVRLLACTDAIDKFLPHETLHSTHGCQSAPSTSEFHPG